MQSKRLEVVDNRSEADDNYGILMNNITDSLLSGNRVEGVTQPLGADGEGRLAGGDGKALFVYNSQFNRIENNRFAASDIGIHLTAGSEDNQMAGNASSLISSKSCMSPPVSRIGRAITGATTWVGILTITVSATPLMNPMTPWIIFSGATPPRAC